MFKRKACRFTRTAAIVDLRFDVYEFIKRKARRYERRNKTAGKTARFL